MKKGVCPHCGSTKFKTLKGSPRSSRCCGEPVVTVDGKWYASKEDAPEWVVMAEVAGRMNVPLEFGDYTYQGWMKGAKNLIARCGGSLDLALRVARLSFEHKNWRWRTYNDIYALLHGRFFAAVLAEAKKQADADDAESKIQSRRAMSGGQHGMELIHAASTF